MIKSIQKLFLLLSPTTKRFIPFILLSLLLIGFLEMISVLLLMPLISSSQFDNAGSGITNTSLSSGLSLTGIIYKLLNIHEIKEMAILVVLFMFVKHILIISLNYAQFKIIFNNDIWLRNSLLDKYLKFDYLKFNKVRSSELIRNTADQVGQISYGSLLSLLTIGTEFIVIIVLLGLVLYSIPLLSAISIILVFLLGLLPFYVFKKRMILLGKIRFNSIAKTISEIQNIYNLYVEIKLYRLKSFFLKRVRSQSVIFSNAQIQNNIITNIPKGVIEIAAVAVILVLIVTTKSGKDFLPTIALIVTSIFRITPSFTRISSALTQYKFSMEQINVLNCVISEDHDEITDISNYNRGNEFSIFHKDICLKNINFAYDKENQLLTDFNLTISKGDFIILKGKSGKGKSTILKILMGMIKPNKGEVLIDDQPLSISEINSWYHQIGYVPQKPVIIEGTLSDNICLGLRNDEIDIERYKSSIQNAQLSEVLQLWGNEKVLSDEGGSISGGQAQRLGIARALYRNPAILLLDEPTSALDHKNAQMIISVLSRLNKVKNYTILIITHSNEFDDFASRVIDL